MPPHIPHLLLWFSISFRMAQHVSPRRNLASKLKHFCSALSSWVMSKCFVRLVYWGLSISEPLQGLQVFSVCRKATRPALAKYAVIQAMTHCNLSWAWTFAVEVIRCILHSGRLSGSALGRFGCTTFHESACRISRVGYPNSPFN